MYLSADSRADVGLAAFVDEMVSRVQSDGATPGLVAGVVRDGRLVHSAAAGAVGAPATDQQSRIGSITKTFAATLVMGLRDEGRLDLDQPLISYVPELRLPTLTARQLLGHASGPRREPPGQWWERIDGGDVPALLASIGPEAVIHRPWTGHHYSNLGYGLLGVLTERITGTPWRDLLADRVLKPLNLARTSYDPTAPVLDGHVIHPWTSVARVEPKPDTGAMAPAGQLWSTVEDLATWAGFLCDPDPAVLAPATLDEMYAPVIIADPLDWNNGHGLGLQLWRDGERIYAGHLGSMPGYLAMCVVHRPSRTGVVGFATSYAIRGTTLVDFGHDLLGAVLDRWPAPPEAPAAWAPAPPPPADVVDLLGRWWWMGQGYDASWDGESLVLAYPKDAFERVEADVWRGTGGENDGETLVVRRDAAGRAVALDVATFLFRREPMDD